MPFSLTSAEETQTGSVSCAPTSSNTIATSQNSVPCSTARNAAKWQEIYNSVKQDWITKKPSNACDIFMFYVIYLSISFALLDTGGRRREEKRKMAASNLFNHSIVCCYCICVLCGNQRLLAQFHVSNPSNTTVPLLLCLPTFLSILAGRSWLPR